MGAIFILRFNNPAGWKAIPMWTKTQWNTSRETFKKMSVSLSIGLAWDSSIKILQVLKFCLVPQAVFYKNYFI